MQFSSILNVSKMVHTFFCIIASAGLFVELPFSETGRTIEWPGKGVDEIGRDAATGDTLVAVHPRYFRPTEVELLIGDPTKAREKLGWVATVTFEQLVRDMVQSDLRVIEREQARKTFID